MQKKIRSVMKKAAIIAQTLKEMGCPSGNEELHCNGDRDDEGLVIETLETLLKKLEPDSSIQTCTDFAHLNSECCEICHTYCPHYEMSLLDVEGSGKAWVCCAVDRALNPKKHSAFKSSYAHKTLMLILDMENHD
jgi:hypothetical protein